MEIASPDNFLSLNYLAASPTWLWMDGTARMNLLRKRIWREIRFSGDKHNRVCCLCTNCFWKPILAHAKYEFVIYVDCVCTFASVRSEHPLVCLQICRIVFHCAILHICICGICTIKIICKLSLICAQIYIFECKCKKIIACKCANLIIR